MLPRGSRFAGVVNRRLRRVPHDAPSPAVIRATATHRLDVRVGRASAANRRPAFAQRATADRLRAVGSPPAPIYTFAAPPLKVARGPASPEHGDPCWNASRSPQPERPAPGGARFGVTRVSGFETSPLLAGSLQNPCQARVLPPNSPTGCSAKNMITGEACAPGGRPVRRYPRIGF
jgi:hypothetical protein